MPIRKLLNAAVIAGCLFAAAALGAGIMADEHPTLDIVNNGLPLLVAGLLGLLLLSLFLRSRMLIVTAGALLAIALAAFIPVLSGGARQASDGAERFLRVATFNMWGNGDLHAGKVEAFLGETGADVVVLEEVRWKHKAFLERLKRTYPHQIGTHGLVILSMHPIVDSGRVDRPKEPYWQSLIVKWARLDVGGREVDVIGAHMARPFYAARQRADIEALTEFVRSRSGPVVVAGDFNATPWTRTLQGFAAATGLGRLNTYLPTWPARWRDWPLLPVLAIDNVFVSPHLAKIDLKIGRRLESDHLPVIADIAFAE